MGELRIALRVYAMEGHSPAEVLSRMGRFIAERGGESMATCVFAAIDVEGSVISIANAAHPAPLIASSEGVRFVEQEAGPPLGGKATHEYKGAEIAIGPGEIVLMYTDGLVERRGRRLSEGQAQLAAAVAAAPLDPELVSAAALDAMLTNGPDDVAVLAAQNLAPVDGRLTLRMSARAEQLVAVRNALRHWLRHSPATKADVSAIVLATGEASANSIEHAYGPGDATFEVEAAHAYGSVEVIVRDFGRWRPPRGRERGRGIGLMRATMDEVEILQGDEGTSVRLVRSLGRESM
jgi:anti-sigma regulatory factor (Ser/Thr protein kinase)